MFVCVLLTNKLDTLICLKIACPEDGIWCCYSLTRCLGVKGSVLPTAVLKSHKYCSQVRYSSSSRFQPLGSSTVVCLLQCRSASFVLFLMVSKTLLHRLVIDPLQCSPSIFCLVVLLIFCRLDTIDVHFWVSLLSFVRRCP